MSETHLTTGRSQACYCGIYTGRTLVAIAVVSAGRDAPARAATLSLPAAVHDPADRMDSYLRAASRCVEALGQLCSRVSAGSDGPGQIALSAYPHGRRATMFAAVEFGAALRIVIRHREWRMLDAPPDAARLPVPAPSSPGAPCAPGQSSPASRAIAHALSLARYARAMDQPIPRPGARQR